MRISHGVFALAISGCVFACGGGNDGAPVNFDALRAQYTSPTGTLAGSGDVKSVTTQFSAQQKQSSGIPLGTQSVRASSAGIHPTDIPSSFSESCPGGGSLSASGLTGSSGTEQATIDYNSCVATAGSVTDTINGSMSFADYTSPPMEIFSGSLTVTENPPGTTETVNLNFAIENGVMKFSLSVADGTVLVSENGSWDWSTDTGTLSITDRSATWSCSLTNGHGTCTSAGHAAIRL